MSRAVRAGSAGSKHQDTSHKLIVEPYLVAKRSYLGWQSNKDTVDYHGDLDDRFQLPENITFDFIKSSYACFMLLKWQKQLRLMILRRLTSPGISPDDIHCLLQYGKTMPMLPYLISPQNAPFTKPFLSSSPGIPPSSCLICSKLGC